MKKIIIALIAALLMIGCIVTARTFYVPGDQDYSCLYNIYNVSSIFMCLNGVLNMNGGSITNIGSINTTNATINSLNMTGNIEMNCMGIINNTNNVSFCSNCSNPSSGWLWNTKTIIGCSDNVRIGNAGVDSHALATDDDLFISGKLEVDGISYFDNLVNFYSHGQFYDDKELRWGNSTDSSIDWSTTQTEHTLIWGLGPISNSLIFVPVINNNSNFTRAPQNNPTIFMHSKNAPTTNLTMAQWGSIGMRDDVREYEFAIDSGTDNITLKDNTMVEGNMTIGDVIGNTMMDMYYNGTEFIMDAPTVNTTFTGDVKIKGKLYGGSPLNIGNDVIVNGGITVNGNLNVTGNTTGNGYYGEMYNFSNVGVPFTFNVSDVYYNMTKMICGSINGFTCINGTGIFTTTVGGVYLVNGFISSNRTSTSVTLNYGVGASKNFMNLETQERCYTRFSGNAPVSTTTFSCIMRLVVGDTVNIMLDVEGSTAANLTVYTKSLNLIRIGD